MQIVDPIKIGATLKILKNHPWTKNNHLFDVRLNTQQQIQWGLDAVEPVVFYTNVRVGKTVRKIRIPEQKTHE